MLVTLLGISLVCAFYGTRLMLWTVSMATAIVLFAVSGLVPVLTLLVTAIAFAAIVIPSPYRYMQAIPLADDHYISDLLFEQLHPVQAELQPIRIQDQVVSNHGFQNLKSLILFP